MLRSRLSTAALAVASYCLFKRTCLRCPEIGTPCLCFAAGALRQLLRVMTASLRACDAFQISLNRHSLPLLFCFSQQAMHSSSRRSLDLQQRSAHAQQVLNRAFNRGLIEPCPRTYVACNSYCYYFCVRIPLLCVRGRVPRATHTAMLCTLK